MGGGGVGRREPYEFQVLHVYWWFSVWRRGKQGSERVKFSLKSQVIIKLRLKSQVSIILGLKSQVIIKFRSNSQVLIKLRLKS